MKKKEKRVKLFVEHAYTRIMSATLLIAGIVMIILLYYCFPPAESRIVEALWISICCIIIIVSLISGAASCQIAILTTEGILFQIAFRKIRLVKWSEVINIEVKELPTYRSPGREFYKKWIVFYTAESQEEKRGGKNTRRNKLPNQIKYTKKNISLLSEFFKTHHFDSLSELIENIQKRQV